MVMRSERLRRNLIAQLQKKIQESDGHLALRYQRGHSNTTRSKSYKQGCQLLTCPPFDQVLEVDPEGQCAHVEPRVTMEQLVKATLRRGLIPPVVPEFKGITVGGALLGAAAESGSHRWGLFHDNCQQIELIDGKGDLIITSPTDKSDLFYGLSGSYGSLGILVGAKISLILAKPTVLLRYYPFKDCHQALEKLQSLTGQVDFLDGIIFSADHAVVIAGEMTSQPSSKASSAWHAQHAHQLRSYREELMPLYDYLFRYDHGAFWMGSFLFNIPFLSLYIRQGLLKAEASLAHFTEKEILRLQKATFPGRLGRFLTAPLMKSQRLWSLLHLAEKWIQDRLVIQDCSIPSARAHHFLDQILTDPGLYPIWLCPLKGTKEAQHFAPHYGHPDLLNFGLYGIPAYAAPMREIIQKLEAKTDEVGGRKVLYSRSYYSEEEFWKIYPQEVYQRIRLQTHAEGKWRGLTTKVLSE